MSNIWFTSDSHFHHKNIVKGTTQWKKELEEGSSHQSTRDFKTLEEHDEAIIQSINKVVRQDDILWHLGDWSFGGIEQIWNFRKRLHCKNINLIFGNHDHHIENYKNFKIVNIYDERLLYNEKCNGKGDIKGGDSSFVEVGINPLFNSTQHTFFGHIGSRTFFLSHYAHRVWNKHHHGVIHLYGHSHDSLDKHPNQPWGKSMDVGIDSAKRILGEYRPFNLNEIVKIMDKRDSLIIDHHNKNTN